MTTTISRIVVTGDFLRPHESDPFRSESVRRIRWFEDLLRGPIEAVTGLPVARLACEGAWDMRTLYADAGRAPSFDAWAELYAGRLDGPLAARIADQCRGAIVVGIELPPSVSAMLAAEGIPVIDSTVDPLRFLIDIPLAFRSTSAAVQRAIEPFRLSPDEINRRVAQIVAKSRWIYEVSVPEGATLVLDQVPTDSALIDPVTGRRVSWADYRDQLAALRDEGPVIWRPHPHNPDAGGVADLLGHHAKTPANIYHLLSHDHLARVAAISSGGVTEARAFGKEGIHYLDRYAGLPLPGWGTPTPVVGHWVSPHFWSAVLAPLVATRPDARELPVEKNFLRRSVNCDWGFSWIDRVVAENDTGVEPPAVHAERARADDAVARMQEETRRQNEIHDRLRAHIAADAARLATLEDQFAHASAERDLWRQRAEDLASRVERAERRADVVERQLSRLRVADRRRVHGVISRLVDDARASGWRVGVFGAGAHTDWLFRETPLAGIPDLALFDSTPALAGQTVAGRVVRPTTELSDAGLDAVVVSSLAFQDEMVRSIEAMKLDGLRIVRCYP